MNRPNFFIVGAPKCGTTTLYEFLHSHPQVYMPERKEPGHFTHGRKNRVASREEYLALFDGAGPQHRAIGEASTGYLFTPGSMEDVKAFQPEARVIVMLREPISLVKSFHSFLAFLGTEDSPKLQDAWRLQSTRAQGKHIPATNNHPLELQYGHVAKLGEHLERAFDIFGRENVHVIFLDDLKDDPAGVYTRVIEFLGLEHDGRSDFPKANVAALHDSAAASHGKIRAFSHTMRRRYPKLRALIPQSISGNVHRWVIQMLAKKGGKPDALDPAFRNELKEYFRSDIKKLEKLTGRDLSKWLK